MAKAALVLVLGLLVLAAAERKAVATLQGAVGAAARLNGERVAAP